MTTEHSPANPAPAPSQGRLQHGAEFVSPNIAEGLDLNAAVKGLSSPRQRALHEAASVINHELGIQGEPEDAVGAWTDGAENSVVTETVGADMEHLKAAAAMQAYLGDQKAALVFDERDGGTDYRFTFNAKGDLKSIHQALLEDGLSFHTLRPAPGGAIVDVIGSDEGLAAAVKKGAERYGATVTVQQGDSAFVGTSLETGTDREQRDDAKQAYAGIIGSAGVPAAVPVWAGVHRAYGDDLVNSHPALKMAA